MPTPPTAAEKAWAYFSEEWFKLGSGHPLRPAELEDLVLDSLMVENELFGTSMPQPGDPIIQQRKERLEESIDRFKSLVQTKKSAQVYLKPIGKIMGIQRDLGIERKYCAAMALSLLEALPVVLSKTEPDGTRPYNYSLIEKMVEEKVSDCRRIKEILTAPRATEDDKKKIRHEVAVGLVSFFNPERYSGPAGVHKPEEVSDFSDAAVMYYDFVKKDEIKERKRKRNSRLATASLAVIAVGAAAGTYYLQDSIDRFFERLIGEQPSVTAPQPTLPAAEKPEDKETLAYVPEPSRPPPTCPPAPTCPKNLQREYFERFNSLLRASSLKNDKVAGIQQVIDDFRAGLTSDYVVKDGTSAVRLMLGPRTEYSGQEKDYDLLTRAIGGSIDNSDLHLYTPDRAQDPGTLILQPTAKPSNPGGK